jgi:hypothetical protein
MEQQSCNLTQGASAGKEGTFFVRKPLEENEHWEGNKNKLDQTFALQYDLEKEKKIHFLIDYSKGLLEYKMTDNKIRDWQKRNLALLKKFGVEAEMLLINDAEKISNFSEAIANSEFMNPEEVNNFLNNGLFLFLDGRRILQVNHRMRELPGE